MPTILDAIFFGGGAGGALKPWRNKAEKFAEDFAEKSVGNIPQFARLKQETQPKCAAHQSMREGRAC